ILSRRTASFPLQKVGTTLMVALASPKDLGALDDLRFACGCEIQVVLALEHEIVEAIDRYHRDEWVPSQPDESAGTVRIDSPATQWLHRDEAAERSAASMLGAGVGPRAQDRADAHPPL